MQGKPEGQATPVSGGSNVRRIVSPVATGLASFGTRRKSGSLGQRRGEKGHRVRRECAFTAAEGIIQKDLFLSGISFGGSQWRSRPTRAGDSRPVFCGTSSRSGELRDGLGAAKPQA